MGSSFGFATSWLLWVQMFPGMVMVASALPPLLATIINQDKLGNNNIFTNSIKEGVIGGEPEPEEESEIIEVEEIDPFRDFQRWISANAPQVAKMKEPFTREQYLKILEDYNEADVLRILESMHNYKPLLTKCVSANLTARNWLRRDNVPKGGGSRPVNGINNNSRSKISNIKNTLEEALTDL